MAEKKLVSKHLLERTWDPHTCAQDEGQSSSSPGHPRTSAAGGSSGGQKCH